MPKITPGAEVRVSARGADDERLGAPASPVTLSQAPISAAFRGGKNSGQERSFSFQKVARSTGLPKASRRVQEIAGLPPRR